MNKKEAIIQSAIKLITEKGIHNTPMSAIAKNAGTGMGTIYNYYPTKEVLINEIYLKIKEEERHLFTDFNIATSIQLQFENYFTAIVSFFCNHSTYFKFIEQLHASPIITEKSKNIGQHSVAPILQLLEKGKQLQEIKNIQTDELLVFIGGAVLSYVRFYFMQQPPNKTISLENQIQLVWDAIKQ